MEPIHNPLKGQADPAETTACSGEHSLNSPLITVDRQPAAVSRTGSCLGPRERFRLDQLNDGLVEMGQQLLKVARCAKEGAACAHPWEGRQISDPQEARDLMFTAESIVLLNFNLLARAYVSDRDLYEISQAIPAVTPPLGLYLLSFHSDPLIRHTALQIIKKDDPQFCCKRAGEILAEDDGTTFGGYGRKEALRLLFDLSPETACEAAQAISANPADQISYFARVALEEYKAEPKPSSWRDPYADLKDCAADMAYYVQAMTQWSLASALPALGFAAKEVESAQRIATLESMVGAWQADRMISAVVCALCRRDREAEISDKAALLLRTHHPKVADLLERFPDKDDTLARNVS